MNSEDGLVYSVCKLQFSCFTKYNRIQSKHKQTNVNIADETLTDYSFLTRYHYTKSKNYFKRRYRIRHWFPMFIGTPSILYILSRFYCYPAFLVSQPSQGLQSNKCEWWNDAYLISKSDINPKFTKPGFVIICDMQVRVFIS